jgi:hypothetical protein
MHCKSCGLEGHSRKTSKKCKKYEPTKKEKTAARFEAVPNQLVGKNF